MPNIDGLEMCKMIKNDPNTNHIPIIVITAKVGKQINFEALQNGADVYLEKPFQQEELMIHIDKLLSSRNELKNYYLNKFQSQNSMSTGMQNMEILNNEPIKDDPFISKAS